MRKKYNIILGLLGVISLIPYIINLTLKTMIPISIDRLIYFSLTIFSVGNLAMYVRYRLLENILFKISTLIYILLNIFILLFDVFTLGLVLLLF